MAATFTDALEGGAAEAIVGGEVLLQALLDGGHLKKLLKLELVK